MERLTEFHNGIWGMSVQAVKDGYDKYSVFSKLAEYENTGLTPEEIGSMTAELNTIHKAYEKLTENNERLQKECVDTYNQLMETEKDAQLAIGELQEKCDAMEDGSRNAYGIYLEYKDAEEQGLLIKVPCKVGDTVYMINREKKITELHAYDIVTNIYAKSDENSSHWKGWEVKSKAIGKTVFLTREAAEEALRMLN